MVAITRFEDLVKIYIELSGFTYAELSKESGVHQGQISKFMAGQTGLNSRSLGAIIDFLGCALNPPTRRISRSQVGRPRQPVNIKIPRNNAVSLTSDAAEMMKSLADQPHGEGEGDGSR